MAGDRRPGDGAAGEPRFVPPPVLARPSLRQLHAARLVSARLPATSCPGPGAEGKAIGGGIAEAPGRDAEGAGAEARAGPRRAGEGEADDASQCDFDLSSSSASRTASAGECEVSRPTSLSEQGTAHGGSGANEDGPRVQQWLPTRPKKCVASPTSRSPSSPSLTPPYSARQGGLATPAAVPPHDTHATTGPSTTSASHDWNTVLSSSSTLARSVGKVGNGIAEAEMSEWEYWGESPPRHLGASLLSSSGHRQAVGQGSSFQLQARRWATSPHDKWRAGGAWGGAWEGAGMGWQNTSHTRAQVQEFSRDAGPDAGPASWHSGSGVENGEGWSTPSLSQLSPCSPLSSSSPVIERASSLLSGARLLTCRCFRSCSCPRMRFLKMADMA